MQQQRFAYSFNTFTNTSFDAQNIVSELLSSPKAYHGAPAKQLHPDASLKKRRPIPTIAH
jgi:hypothetical protein